MTSVKEVCLVEALCISLLMSLKLKFRTQLKEMQTPRESQRQLELLTLFSLIFVFPAEPKVSEEIYMCEIDICKIGIFLCMCTYIHKNIHILHLYK